MKRYEHVIVIGVDGMGCFNNFTHTPNMDRIFAHGAVTDKGLSMVPTISAQNWGGMLLGCDPIVHGLTNSHVESNLYTNDNLPSLFRRIRQAYPDDVLASYCNWNPINHGIIEHNLGVAFETADDDDVLTERIIEKISDKPTFFFIQLDNTDGAGHRHGYGEEGHLASIRKADEQIGRIYDEYVRLGINDDTLFIVTADHGGFRKSHGGYSAGEKYVYFAAVGKNVSKGRVKCFYTKDISSIVLYALGIDLPGYTDGNYTSQVPEGLFEGYEKEYILPEIKEPTKKQFDFVTYEAEGGLKEAFGDKLKLAMFFENSLKDETGKCNFTEDGTFKYYSDGVSSFCGEGGLNGAAYTQDLSVADKSFSVALWIETSLGLVDEAAVCGNKEWDEKNDNDKGWNIVLRSHDILFFLADGNRRVEYIIPFAERTTDGWVHFLASVDKEQKKVSFYRDFRFVMSAPIDDVYCIDLDNRLFTVGNDTTLTFNNVLYTKTVRMDDILVFDGALSEDEVLKLKQTGYKNES